MELPSKEYELTTQILGCGSGGTVFLGRKISTQQEVAIKRITLSELSENGRNHLPIEIDVLEMLDHPHLTKLLDVIYDKDYVFLVHEFYAGGDLYDYVMDHDSLSELEVSFLLRQLAEAIHWLHSQNIVHHDLSLENVMLKQRISQQNSNDHQPWRHMQLKLIDFGFCERVKSNQLLAKFSGSDAYVAPELLEGEPYSGKAIDVWSFGVVLFILITKRFPFNHEDVDKMYDEATSPEYLDALLDEHILSKGAEDDSVHNLYDLIKRIFDPNPSTRITMDEVILHPWFTGATSGIHAFDHS